MKKTRMGIIGGSGLYEMDGVEVLEERRMETPFGMPSDAFVIGHLEGQEFVFLPRHGRGHRILPHEINYRANIFAMKVLGVEGIISVSSVGSMKEHIHPGDLVMIDQFVDRTKMRQQTFFGDGIAAHVSFADPICPCLKSAAVEAAKRAGVNALGGGTYICVEGPMFSSRAESNIYRQWGVDVIGMTNYQEAKLAREAEICYATIALVTDYDCWHAEEGPVDVETVVRTLQNNVKKAKATIREVFKAGDVRCDCTCREALKGAIMTDPSTIKNDLKLKLKPIIGKYLP
jgi:5'-methylthioadenosine phosphorylase